MLQNKTVLSIVYASKCKIIVMYIKNYILYKRPKVT